MCRECQERFPRYQLQMKPLVSDPCMHHGTYVTCVPRCMSGSLIRGVLWNKRHICYFLVAGRDTGRVIFFTIFGKYWRQTAESYHKMMQKKNIIQDDDGRINMKRWTPQRQSLISLNPMWPSDTKWRHWSESSLADVMACCLTAPSHYPKPFWPLINEVIWHSLECIFAQSV